MESIFNKVNGFINGLGSIFLGLVPVSILWTVLSGTSIFGMDVVGNLTSLVNTLGNGGFVGFIVLVVLWSFFTDKK
jgi:hypothetical protein